MYVSLCLTYVLFKPRPNNYVDYVLLFTCTRQDPADKPHARKHSRTLYEDPLDENVSNFRTQPYAVAWLGIHQGGVQWEWGAVDWGRII